MSSMLNLNKNPLVDSTKLSTQSIGSSNSKNSSSEFAELLNEEPVVQNNSAFENNADSERQTAFKTEGVLNSRMNDTLPQDLLLESDVEPQPGISIEQPSLGLEDANVYGEMIGHVQLSTESVVPLVGTGAFLDARINSKNVLDIPAEPQVIFRPSTDPKTTAIVSEVFAMLHSSVANAALPLNEKILRSSANMKWSNSNALSTTRNEEQTVLSDFAEPSSNDILKFALPAEEIVSSSLPKGQHKQLDGIHSIDFKSIDNMPINQIAKAATDSLNPVSGVTLLSTSTQTLVDVIRENSSWTTHLTTPTAQSTSIVKADGGVLQSLKVQLNPIELGKVELHLRMVNGLMQVEVRPETEKTFLNLAMEQENLLSTLKGLGFKVDSVSIVSPTSTQNSLHQSSPETGERHSNENPKHERQDSGESQKQVYEVGHVSNQLAENATLSKNVI